ncbi:MarR family transcriptional regulator [Novosphingobium sp.]|uniref:MarR family winged helix-turn-helix transcriptional regulator n=1 Tax=Novosphingobium sp. TaxID=1874826 RepID=UPI00286E1286|nr:MarR family transcriptional regulator [Novosphingobium sp.]
MDENPGKTENLGKDENIAMLMAQVSRLMRRTFDEKARLLGMTRPQWQVISILSVNEGINQGGLAELLEVEPITLGRMVDRLQDAALVERRPDPADRRAWRLHLTDKAQGLLVQLRPLALDTIDAAQEGLSQPERDGLITAMQVMRSNLSRKA